jgi:hypothetical protein
VQSKFQTHKENWPNLIFGIAHTLSILGRFLMPGPLIDWLRITISYLNPHRSFPSHCLTSKPFLSRRRQKTLDCFIPSGTYATDHKRRHLPLQPCAHSLSSIMPWSLAVFLVHPKFVSLWPWDEQLSPPIFHLCSSPVDFYFRYHHHHCFLRIHH